MKIAEAVIVYNIIENVNLNKTTMISDRKIAFDTISRVFAITKLDIEHHQAIGEYSLNIHGENYFRDIFNIVYDSNFVNANLDNLNAPYIDLVDSNKKRLIQITTTRTKEKILHSLQALKIEKYKSYDISIFYLLDKANPSQATIDEIKNIYSDINLKNILKDSGDLMADINSLESNKIIELSEKYFKVHKQKYTDKIALDLIFKKLLKEKQNIQISYDDNLGSIETSEKIILNNINEKISNKINDSLDYSCIIEAIDDGELVTNLRALVVNDLYKEILINQLKSKITKSILLDMDISSLQKNAVIEKLDFNKLIYLLQQKIDSLIIVSDFNSMTISWILVAYFFEICEVGVKE